jgi:hypothetical protein
MINGGIVLPGMQYHNLNGLKKVIETEWERYD